MASAVIPEMGAFHRDVPVKVDAAEESANMLWIRATGAPEARAKEVTRQARFQPASSNMMSLTPRAPGLKPGVVVT